MNNSGNRFHSLLNKPRFQLVIYVLCWALVFSTGCLSTREITEKDQSLSPGQEVEPTGIDSSSSADSISTPLLPIGIPIPAGTDSSASALSQTMDSSLLETLPDSANVVSPDSTVADSLISDSLETVGEEKEDVQADTSIDYKAEDIHFDVVHRITTLTGNASISYQSMKLDAHKIVVNWDNDLMTATSTNDTIWTDTTNTEIDTIRVIGTPTFVEKNQTMTGEKIRVNMETKQGYVVGGRTQYDEGYYHGHEIQKVTDKVLYVHDGRFTTCDQDCPHYKFTGNKMKMVHKEKVVGKPVVLRFGDVPVFALPYAIFSLKPGRHSGIIIPTYGDRGERGRNLRDFGYYFAFSDYWDAKVRMDFFEKAGMLFKGDFKYNVRYKMNGAISGSFDNQVTTGSSGRKADWDLHFNHNQDINPTLKIRAKGTFVSQGGYYQSYSDNPGVRLNKKINSNATITKTWPGTSTRLSVNLSHEQNLETEANKQTLPNASLSFGTKNLFPSERDKRGKEKNIIYSPPEPRQEGVEDEEEDEDRWYNTITYSYNAKLKNLRDESPVLTSTAGDEMKETFTSGIRHTVGLNAPQKIMKYFTFNPRFSYTEDWVNERRVYSLNSEDNVVNEQERGFFQRRTFTTGVNTNTKFYGYFNINRFGVNVIRHVVTPSVGFSYRPDFSVGDDWGYYQELYKEDGSRIRLDRYAGSTFGGTPRNRQLSMNFSLSNLFQMKRIKVNEEGEEEEIKTDLFTYNLSTNFDFAKDSLNWGNLSSNFRASPITTKNRIGPLEQMSVDFNMTHSFYQYSDYVDNNGIQRRGIMDKFYWEEPGHGLNVLRMTGFSANSSFTFSGASPFVKKSQKRDQKGTVGRRAGPGDGFDTEDDLPPVDTDFENRFSNPDVYGGAGTGKPWRVSANLRYNLSMNDPQKSSETLRLTGSTTVNLTKNWSVSYSSGVDLITRYLTGASLTLKRDLHCWQGSLSWSPVGFNQGFWLLISVKAPQLKDVKLEQRRGGSGVLPSYF